MSDLSDLEAEAAASRARLEDTIGRIQDKLTLSGMVDDFIGSTGAAGLAGGRDMLSVLLNRHPLPVMIAAAGVGFLIHRRNHRRPLAGEPLEGPAHASPAGAQEAGET
ncbi:hypothetical protein [Enterovirga sp.]|uniref:hypothetical protein n=1 Tax=Enterovirga sp. TaxID=2026350 RepID=UPI002BD89B0A|nr:hypothetical protein [Enterovirga sp.]HMO28175.1 hypothetical protein [Enterovirga sp.]